MKLRHALATIAAAGCLALPFAPNPVTAAAPAHEAAHAETVVMDGWASALLHNHVYDCYGVSGKNSICVDPTTGFGPVLFVCNGTSCSWTTGVSGACLWPQADEFNGAQRARWYNDGSNMLFGAGDNLFNVSTGAYAGQCSGPTEWGSTWMPQSIMDQVVWLTYSGTWYIHMVH